MRYDSTEGRAAFWRSLAWTLALLAVALVAVGARLAAAPLAGGQRPAMSARPDGHLYLADPRAGLVLVAPDGFSRRLSALPPGLPLALAARGPLLVLGTEAGLYLSSDGTSWRRAPNVPGGRFLAVAGSARMLAAAAWGGGIWASGDGGSTWSAGAVPGGAVEVRSIAIDDGPDACAGCRPVAVAADLTGLLRSSDLGATWLPVGGPARMTSVDVAEAGFLAGDWAGDLLQSVDGTGWLPAAHLPGGIWQVAASQRAAATTRGLFLDGRLAGAPLAGGEVTALAGGGGTLYAALAGGQLLASTDGGFTWRMFRDG